MKNENLQTQDCLIQEQRTILTRICYRDMIRNEEATLLIVLECRRLSFFVCIKVDVALRKGRGTTAV